MKKKKTVRHKKDSTKYRYVWGVKCPRCGQKIWSRHRHDFRYCDCKYSFIDGGRDYMRVGWGDQTKVDGRGCADVSPGLPRTVKIRVLASELETQREPRWPY